MKGCAILLMFLLTFCPSLMAGSSQEDMSQSVKKVKVADGSPFVDHLSLDKSSPDLDLIVKIAFNEGSNSLTVSLLSYHSLFVFQADVRYGQVVRFGKLSHEKLPYVADSEINAVYRTGHDLRKSIKHRRRHVFSMWYEQKGLKPQPSKYKMVNDYIEQIFDIIDSTDRVEFTVRDILAMQEVTGKKKKKTYELFSLSELSRKYDITIVRNPCFGRDADIQRYADMAKNIRDSYEAFSSQFGEDESVTEESEKIFQEIKTLLTSQFPRIEGVDLCPDVQKNIDQYNSYVDSIALVQRRIIQQQKEAATLDVPAKVILGLSREMDGKVGRWLMAADPVEKADLVKDCEKMIADLEAQIEKAEIISDEQNEAIATFRKAEEYYRRTCLTKK